MICLTILILFQALQKLLEMGFSEQEATDALRVSRNDQDAAVRSHIHNPYLVLRAHVGHGRHRDMKNIESLWGTGNTGTCRIRGTDY